MEAAGLVEVVRQPDQEEPPGGVGDELPGDEGPGLGIAEQARPGHLFLGRRSGRAVVDVGQLTLAEEPRFFRHLIKRQPECEPENAGDAGDNEGGLPTPVERNPRDHDGRKHGSEIRAAVQKGGGKGALPLGEPEGDRFDRRWEIAPLGGTEPRPGDEESAQVGGESVAGGGDAPGAHRKGIAQLRPEGVDEPAEGHLAERIGPLEGRIDPAKILVGPVHALVQDGFDEGKDLPVRVIDRGGQEQEKADEPAKPAEPGRRGHGAGHREGVIDNAMAVSKKCGLRFAATFPPRRRLDIGAFGAYETLPWMPLPPRSRSP